ncbi:hypothetical protein DCC81_05205 [Chitinophaga parva]|uniref:Uncharacterized protein n=1 Tax=Chitinophaga parva TaxID=2169414 RepID=A0A2T7BMK5_9BACT|nr:hypothetical protein [Chitinophaga parva]PUZ28879.1 hypothetical protein DCC81_05205 [Chitinophaga parva]
MLQNRVDPYGHLIRTPARGAWMGNRGLLHNEHQQIQRTFKLKAWITCVLEFKGRKRTVMAPHRYTELFFPDEATAFSAGHRPCFECRRADAQRFKAAWLQGNPDAGFNEQTSINHIDNLLHAERINKKGEKVTYDAAAGTLPDGTFIVYNDHPHVIAGGQLYPWHATGYGTAVPLPAGHMVTVLTPRSIVNAFNAGYHPQRQLPA